MSKLSRDLATPVGGLTTLNPRETLRIAGLLASNVAEVILPVDGCSTVAFDVRGVYVGNLTLEGTVDGVNYLPIMVRQFGSTSVAYFVNVTTSAVGIFVGQCPFFVAVRVRFLSYTSGSATVTLIAHNGVFDDVTGKSTSQIVTTTSLVGAAVTLTIPNPGTGLRQQLMFIDILRSATVLLTAAATPTIITTTNLPGALQFSMGQDAAPIGGDKIIRYDFRIPLAASAIATNTTIVCPITAGVVWRITAGYFVSQ